MISIDFFLLIYDEKKDVRINWSPESTRILCQMDLKKDCICDMESYSNGFTWTKTLIRNWPMIWNRICEEAGPLGLYQTL